MNIQQMHFMQEIAEDWKEWLHETQQMMAKKPWAWRIPAIALIIIGSLLGLALGGYIFAGLIPFILIVAFAEGFINGHPYTYKVAAWIATFLVYIVIFEIFFR